MRDHARRLVADLSGTGDLAIFTTKNDVQAGALLPRPAPFSASFTNDAGCRGQLTISGLYVSSYSLDDTGHLSATARVDSVEATFDNDRAPTSHVEWLTNFDSELVFPCRTVRQRTHTTSRERAGLTESSGALASGERALDHFQLKLTIEDSEYILNVGKCLKSDATYLPGFIQFLSSDSNFPNDEQRARIIEALSFTFGRHFTSCGWTTFSDNWKPVKAFARSPYGGENAYLAQQPNKYPTPINEARTGYTIVISAEKVRLIVQAFLDGPTYLSYPIWLFSVANQSPLDIAAAPLGAALEAVRDGYLKEKDEKETTDLGRVISRDAWKSLFSRVEKEVEQLTGIEKDRITMLTNNLRNANNRSSGAKYPLFYEYLKWAVGNGEKRALAARNTASHGKRLNTKDYEDLRWDVMALQTLFNRAILAVLNLDVEYVDYSTLSFPTRKLDVQLGGASVAELDEQQSEQAKGTSE